MIFDAIAYVVCGIFNTLYTLVILLLFIVLCTLIVLLVPVIYVDEKQKELASLCRKLIDSISKARSRWRNRPRVKTGPMPVIGHPYR